MITERGEATLFIMAVAFGVFVAAMAVGNLVDQWDEISLWWMEE